MHSEVIQSNTLMETAIERKPVSFRLRTDVVERLKKKAACQNRSLNNYVELLLLEEAYDEPNEVTKAALAEAMHRTEYPEEEVYDSVEALFKALDAE